MSKHTAVFALGAALAISATATADVREFEISLSAAPSVDSFGDSDNYAELFDINAALGLPAGSPVSVLAIGYDLDIETIGDSYLADVLFHFDDADAALPPSSAAFEINPGFGDEMTGSMGYASPMTDLSSALSLSSGSLYFELYEDFDDTFGEAEAFVGGTITLRVDVIPAPATLAAFGLFAGVAARRRR
ncbi:MAG: hypothetical protein ACIAQU_03140 [Phycisphaerales bacterium JB064]